MKYMLDTNICIYIIKKTPQKVIDKFKNIKLGEIGISSITYCELQYGVANSKMKKENQDALNEFLTPLNILDYPGDAAHTYGEIRAKLKKIGDRIGQLDLLISTHAVHINATLITNNINEFNKIENLKIENWV
ncbi:type II toxin-antitoxin system VapC family toxin [candidate division KSB1 bacterium]|nr:type II toxin-antitoxin system VapC family toxin [candidate division KSB1 bacterium]